MFSAFFAETTFIPETDVTVFKMKALLNTETENWDSHYIIYTIYKASCRTTLCIVKTIKHFISRTRKSWKKHYSVACLKWDHMGERRCVLILIETTHFETAASDSSANLNEEYITERQENLC